MESPFSIAWRTKASTSFAAMASNRRSAGRRSKRMLEMGLPVGAGTDGTRVASYHPWTCLWWMVTSKTVGGTVLHDESDRLTAKKRSGSTRTAAPGSATRTTGKGRSPSGTLPIWPCLSDDYFASTTTQSAVWKACLTIVGGKVVHGAKKYADLAPPLPPVSPDWSPVARFGGYDNSMPVPPIHEHTPIMSADGRVWEAGCGCGI